MRYIKLVYTLSFLLVFDQHLVFTKKLLDESAQLQDTKTKKTKKTKKVRKTFATLEQNEPGVDQDESNVQENEPAVITEVKTSYEELQGQIQKLQEEFFEKITTEIESLKSYSSQKAEKFINFLNDELTGFRHQIRTIGNQAIANYFSSLQHHDEDFSYDNDLTASQIAFIDGVDNIVQESLIIVQKMVLDITSQNIQKSVSLDIKHGFFESERHAQMVYEKQLKANEEAANKSWWDDLIDYGESYLKEFKPIAKEAIGKEVAKQTQNFINEVGSEVASEVGKELSDLANKSITPELKEKILGLTSKITSITPEMKEKLSTLTEMFRSKGYAFWESEAFNNAALGLVRKVVRLKQKVEVSGEVTVRSGDNLCAQEQKFLSNRTKKIQEVLKKEFGIDQPLRIAFCCSGGGNRAMIGTLGILTAAAKYNVLQSTTYLVGLSGSTWTIAPWVYFYAKGLLNNATYKDSLADLKKNFVSTLNDSSMLDPLKNNIFTPPMLKGGGLHKDFVNQIVERFSFDQPISLVNPWGALIGNYTLNIGKDGRLDLAWSDINSLVVNGNLPLPLCSSVFNVNSDDDQGSKDNKSNQYEWFESGPFEAGSKVLGYVPTKYFGSPFAEGKIIAELACPEYPMSFYLGMYGSEFSLSLGGLIEKGLKDPEIDVLGQPVTIPVAEWIKKMIKEGPASHVLEKHYDRMHAKFSNFSKGLSDSYLKDKDVIGLFDGDAAFNIPLPLVLDHKERAVDIVIIYDSNPGDLKALQAADAYFKRKNIAVPTLGGVSKEDLVKGKYPMTVFNDPRDTSYDEKQPTLIYFPTNVDVKNPPFITENFKYTQKDIDTLMTKASGSFENHMKDIKVIMKKVADARHKKAESKTENASSESKE